MTQDNRNHDLESAARAVRNDQPSAEQVREAGGRIWQNLQGTAAAAQQLEPIRGCEDVTRLLPAFAARQLSPERTLLIQSHLHECANCRARAEHRTPEVNWAPVAAMRSTRRWSGFAIAAAIVLIAAAVFVVNNMYFAVPAGARASIQSIDGIAYRVTPQGDRVAVAGDQLGEGEVITTAAGSHAYLKLSDGSLVEVNERTNFAIKARGKDMTIALDRGAVIVQAAKRTAGHLFVKTPDARVSVTGTVFAVNAAVKGSRVSVMEGTVEVRGGGKDSILHSGDQLSTSANMAPVPVAQDIAWSRDLPKHLELLAQFSKLQKRLEQVQLPGPRYNSDLLNRMPADAIVYASMPNAGQALEEANRILQDQMQQSDALRQWWTHGDPNAQAKLNETIAKIRQLSDYLGDEVVLVGFNGQNHNGGVAIVADVRRSGVREFLQTQFASVGEGNKIQVVDEAGLKSLAATNDGPIALVRQNEIVFSSGRDILERVNAGLNSGTGGLGATEFGQRLADAYSRGAAFLFAADLHKIMSNSKQVAVNKRHRSDGVDRSGFGDMRYLIAEHRELNGAPENRMVLDFAGQRRGIASWLAPPAPMGSLEFVSRNAAVAVAFIAKDPQLMLNDVLNMTDGDKSRQQSEIADMEARMNLRIREDLAAHFGGDGVIALDGPVLPTPTWKLVIEVHDEAGLAQSLEKLVNGINAEAQHKGKPGVEIRTEDANGQRYYAIHSHQPTATDVYYTFSGGYMIVGPNRATLMNTLQTRTNGDSLARSGEFKALLPKDENANYSLIAYQNLSPILQPLTSQLSGERVKIVQELAADSRPSVACAWGKQNRIEAVTNSRLLGFDWLALGSLLENKGTSHKQKP